MNKRDYSFGVYYYVDLETGLIDYIGFDSHIDSKYNRHYQHLNWKPSITFEEILQKNPDRWEYHIYKKFETLEEDNNYNSDFVKEMDEIKEEKPIIIKEKSDLFDDE
jgi:hypothetical protein